MAGALTASATLATVRPMGRRSAISTAAAALGRKGGSARTEAQNAARRANGLAGGRPVKLRTLAGVEVHVGADLAGHLKDGRPAFVATSPTAARWLARHGYAWGVYEFRGGIVRDLPRGGAWARPAGP